MTAHVWTPMARRLLTLLSNSTVSQREAAIYLGVTPAAVAQQARKMGLHFHGQPKGRLKWPPGSKAETPPTLYGL